MKSYDSNSAETISIVVGSENPVKVNAALTGAEKVFGIDRRIICTGCEVGLLLVFFAKQTRFVSSITLCV